MAKQKQPENKPVGGAVTVMELPMSAIDMGPAAKVREELDQATVEEYALNEDDWCKTKPIDVFEGGGKFYGSDGRHRFSARLKNGHKKILCRVTKCATAEDALDLARRHSWTANAGNALQRSDRDKQATVRDCILHPANVEASDREIAAMCKVVHGVVSRCRQALTNNLEVTGRAASTDENRKSHNPSGKTKKTEPAESGRAATSQPTPEPDAPAASADVATPVKARPDGRIIDACGRVVPEPLEPIFGPGKTFVNDLRGTFKEVTESVKSSAGELWGGGFAVILPTVESDLKKIAQDVAANIPYCVCPHLNNDGVHALPGNCKVCVGNRGWLSRHNWHQQGDGIKKLIDDLASEKPQPEAA